MTGNSPKGGRLLNVLGPIKPAPCGRSFRLFLNFGAVHGDGRHSLPSRPSCRLRLAGSAAVKGITGRCARPHARHHRLIGTTNLRATALRMAEDAKALDAKFASACAIVERDRGTAERRSLRTNCTPISRMRFALEMLTETDERRGQGTARQDDERRPRRTRQPDRLQPHLLAL